MVNSWIITRFLVIFSTFSKCSYEVWWLQRRYAAFLENEHKEALLQEEERKQREQAQPARIAATWSGISQPNHRKYKLRKSCTSNVKIKCNFVCLILSWTISYVIAIMQIGLFCLFDPIVLVWLHMEAEFAANKLVIMLFYKAVLF